MGHTPFTVKSCKELFAEALSAATSGKITKDQFMKAATPDEVCNLLEEGEAHPGQVTKALADYKLGMSRLNCFILKLS